MLRNYLLITLRNIRRNKTILLINICGLTIGLDCILEGMFIWQESHYDDFHVNSDNIYRTTLKFTFPNGSSHRADTSALLRPTVAENFPKKDQYAN